MACGCCPIASDTGGNPELVVDGECGLLFESGNAAALAAQLRLLLHDCELRRKFAEAAALRARREFSREAAVARMQAIYEEFLTR